MLSLSITVRAESISMHRVSIPTSPANANGMHTLETPKEYIYEASPVDITVVNKGGSKVPRGSSSFKVDNHFVWGGSVIQAEDGNYYMIYCAQEAHVHTFNQAWVLGSMLGIAKSSKPDRDFKHLKYFYNTDGFTPDTSSWDAQTVVNPHIKRFNGTYYLYYAGSVNPKADVPVVGSVNLRGRIQQNQKIGVIVFNSFDELLKGQFKKFDQPLLSPRTRVKPSNIVNPSPTGTVAKPDNIIVVNPSVVFRPSDQKYLLYFKGNLYDPRWRGVHGVAISDAPTGPFVPLDQTVFDLDVGGNVKLSAEDPYAWYCKKDQLFYAVFKDFTGKFTKGKPCLAIMYSKDGLDWILPKNSEFMKTELLLSTGETVKVHRLERPQLLLDAEGIPTVLYAACSIDDVNNKTDGSSFNVHIALKRRPAIALNPTSP